MQQRGALCISRANERKQKQAAEFAAKHPEGGSDVIELINQIPIEQVVMQLPLGCKVSAEKKDGGLRFSDDQGKERGFFKHKDYNIIIHEGTALFDPPEDKGYNPLGLVKAVLGCDAHEAIQWFCSKSAVIREADRLQREAWAKENEAKEVIFFDELLSKQKQ